MVDIELFVKDKTAKDGLHSRCKDCHALKQRQRNSHKYKNKEEYNSYMREYNKANSEKKRVRDKRYREENSGKIAEYNRSYRKSNLERKRELNRNYKSIRRSMTTGEGVDYSTIKQMDNMICYLCGFRITENDLHFDHIEPLSKGGKHTEDNLACTHSKCNQEKSNKTLLVHLLTKKVR